MKFLIRAEVAGKPPLSTELAEGCRLTIGRSAQAGLRISEDQEISRLHAEILLDQGRLTVRRKPEATNPIYRQGRSVEEFTLGPGESFMLGRTKLTFLSVGTRAPPKTRPQPPGDVEHVEVMTMSPQDLYAMGGPGGRLKYSDLLQVPELLRKRERQDFYAQLARLIRGATDGSFACVVTQEGKVLGEDTAPGALRFHPSQTLIRKSCAVAPQPTLYSWSRLESELASRQEGLDWAVCAAANVPHEPAVVFYVAGAKTGAGSESLQRERARFVGLIADMVGRSLAMDRLAIWEGRLERFFAGPVVSKILSSPDLRDMEPKLAQSTVMFFDIRGFSRRTEEKNEVILQYVGELRRALTAMTGIVMEERGVVLLYMGDGMLACWNVPFCDAAHVDLAARAALRMVEAFSRQTGGWRCGVGLHTGEVVAGAVGSEQVFSYGLLGAVVNQASRVEGITKVLGVSILVSSEVALRLSRDAAAAVPVGRFRPAGMDSAMDLFELVPPPGDLGRLEAFQCGTEAIKKGRWEEAARIFRGLPKEDKPAGYLRALAEKPPAKWEGVIELGQK